MHTALAAGDFATAGAGDLEDRLKLIGFTIHKGYADPWSHEWVAALVTGRPLEMGVGAGGEPLYINPFGFALHPKDDEGELRRLFTALAWPHVRYTYHPRGKDRFTTLRNTIQTRGADCLPAGTLILRRDGHLVPIEQIQTGDEIMGDGTWTKVLDTAAKGRKPIMRFQLNNGSVLRCTPDHRLFVVPKKHENGNRASRKARVTLSPGQREWAEEVRAHDLHVGEDLLTPERIPYNTGGMDPDLGWLLGTFVADGCLQDKHYINISGADSRIRRPDSHKKDKAPQKERVLEIARRFGFEGKSYSRYALVKSPEWAEWLRACGHGAPNKRLPTLNLDEGAAHSVMSGLIADAWKAPSGAFVHVTTSPLLALQTRVLWRMMGRNTSIRWRSREDKGWSRDAKVIAWPNEAAGGIRIKPFPRVKSIEAEDAEEVFDLTTDTHRFWLPESDVVVHNCDQQVVAVATAAHLLGFMVGARVYSHTGDEWNHIAPLIALPREFPTLDAKGVPVDVLVLELTSGPQGTPESARFGWQEPLSRVAMYRDFWFDLR